MSEKKNKQYRQIVERAAGLAQKLPSESLNIQSLCDTVMVSQRMLRRAFHHVHGIAPYRYIRRLRMAEAMKALSSPTSPSVTVTQVAIDFGFLELGRFAVEYRAMFGERPSVTLRRALASRSSGSGQRPARIADRSRTAGLHEVRA